MQRWNPNQPPEDGLPPQEVHVTELRAEPWPEDNLRVRVSLQITPFLERPNLEILILDEEGQEVSSINIIESIDDRMTFTMHIRREEPQGNYTLTARIQYPEIGVVNEKEYKFAIHQNNQS